MTLIPSQILAILVVLLLTWLASAHPAMAGDGLHEVCVGQVNVGASALLPTSNGMDKLAMVYDDQREGSFKRKITVAMVYGNSTYVGEDTISLDANTTKLPAAKLVLRNVDDPKDVVFKGAVKVLDAYAGIRIDGDYITGDKQVHHLHTKLAGYQIPYAPAPAPTTSSGQ